MVEWSETDKQLIKERYDREYLGWARILPLTDDAIEECKESIMESVKERLDISTIKTEWVIMTSPISDPLDQSLMVCLRQEVLDNG